MKDDQGSQEQLSRLNRKTPSNEMKNCTLSKFSERKPIETIQQSIIQ